MEMTPPITLLILLMGVGGGFQGGGRGRRPLAPSLRNIQQIHLTATSLHKAKPG